jgi:hypothetical protein
MALSTVPGILTRIGMGKLGRLGQEPARRYERQRPGELIHIDVKQLGRIHGGIGHRFAGKPGQRRAADRRTGADGHRRNLVGWEYVPSTTPPAWPTSRCSPTRRPRPLSGSFAAPSRTSTATASASSG